MKKDPVCNMNVDEKEAVTTECEDKFLKEKACKLPCTSHDLIIIGGGPCWTSSRSVCGNPEDACLSDNQRPRRVGD